MKVVVIALLALAVLTLLLAMAGTLLPERHVAVVETRLVASSETVYALIHDVRGGPTWRSGLEQVEILSADEPLRWRETADWGALAFERVVDEPSRRVVHRIIDEGQGFGGTWTWEIERDGEGTLLRITEEGSISNPFFRLLSKFVLGHHGGIETYARDLGRRLGETVEPYRPVVGSGEDRSLHRLGQSARNNESHRPRPVRIARRPRAARDPRARY